MFRPALPLTLAGGPSSGAGLDNNRDTALATPTLPSPYLLTSSQLGSHFLC